jgi:hypothetical protein
MNPPKLDVILVLIIVPILDVVIIELDPVITKKVPDDILKLVVVLLVPLRLTTVPVANAPFPDVIVFTARLVVVIPVANKVVIVPVGATNVPVLNDPNAPFTDITVLEIKLLVVKFETFNEVPDRFVAVISETFKEVPDAAVNTRLAVVTLLNIPAPNAETSP